MRKLLLVVFLFTVSIKHIAAQSFPKGEIMDNIKADKIEMDGGNGDGVFKARDRKTKKWGMYQWAFSGVEVKEMIPMKYDSLRYFPFNGYFTAVYNDGKVGIYLCEWSYGENAKQTVECKYEDYRRIKVRADQYSSPTTYLAMKKNGKWGYVDWLTAEEKSEFNYESAKKLPYPDFKQKLFE